MPNNSLNQFKTAFRGGSRANRFVVNSGFPDGVSNANLAYNRGRFTITSGSLPKADIGVVGVPFRGRMAYYAGDRQYTVWPITVYDDNNNLLWSSFHKWKELMDGHVTHKVANNDYSYASLQKDWTIEQLDNNGNTIRHIRLHRCWPSEVGGINFDMGSSDMVTFQVTLTFDHISFITGT